MNLERKAPFILPAFLIIIEINPFSTEANRERFEKSFKGEFSAKLPKPCRPNSLL